MLCRHHPWKEETNSARGAKRARDAGRRRRRPRRPRGFTCVRQLRGETLVQQQVTAGCGKEQPLSPIGQQAAMISHAGEAAGALARPRLRLTPEESVVFTVPSPCQGS